MHTFVIVMFFLAAIAFGAGSVVRWMARDAGGALVAIGLFLWVLALLGPLVIK
jgi:hypothetical protein